jgi:MerR HTH family regulatory protein
MIGVPVATIRTWEDRYGLAIPDRSASGHRLYRRDQVGQLPGRMVRGRKIVTRRHAVWVVAA